MKPTNLRKSKYTRNLTDEQKLMLLGSWAARNGNVPKGTILAPTQVPACPRVKVKDFPEGWLPTRYIETLEHNQQIKSCCRHPENHEIEARKSHPDEKLPDTYIFYCPCGCKHVRFMLGVIDNDLRPVWEAA